MIGLDEFFPAEIVPSHGCRIHPRREGAERWHILELEGQAVRSPSQGGKSAGDTRGE